MPRASSARLSDDIVVATPGLASPANEASTQADRIGNLEFMESGIVILFGLTSFLASALLFSVQPMIGKMVLPVFGGTPAVWNTCLVFFQGTLLCGYLLSYGVGRTGWTGPRRISGFYLAGACSLFWPPATCMQPIVLGAGGDRSLWPGGNPALVLLGVLLGSAALPLVMVSATAPLVQGWFALTGHPAAGDPYFLYAASNAGSLLALLAYPFRDRAQPGLDRPEPTLEDRFSRFWRYWCWPAAWRPGA